MTVSYGEPDPYDPDFYASVGHADLEAYPYSRARQVREAFQLKRQQIEQERLAHASPPSRGALGWILSAPDVDEAPGRCPGSKVRAQHHPSVHESTAASRRHNDDEQRRMGSTPPPPGGHAAPSIHTILDIATRSASEARLGPAASSSPLQPRAVGAILGDYRGPRTPSNNSSPLTTSTHESGTATRLPSFVTDMELRRGKWTRAEEVYAAATIQYFCSGLLNLQFGTLLRGFLAQQLHCHPMRISKKLLPGTRFHGVEITRKLGRRAYSPRWCDSPQATHEKLEAEQHLAMLRTKFVASLEEEAQMLTEEAEGKSAAKEPAETKGKSERPAVEAAAYKSPRVKETSSLSPTRKEDVQVVQGLVDGAAPRRLGRVQGADQKRARDEERTIVGLQPRHHRRHHHEFQQRDGSYREDPAPIGWRPERVFPVRIAVASRTSYSGRSGGGGRPNERAPSQVRLVLPSLRESLERASAMR